MSAYTPKIFVSKTILENYKERPRASVGAPVGRRLASLGWPASLDQRPIGGLPLGLLVWVGSEARTEEQAMKEGR
jgi:hypothetical protein